jgi:hypothetical protein
MRGRILFKRWKQLRPPNPTWRDIKQLAYAFLLVVPMIGVVCYGASRLVGPLAALWIAVGLVSLTGVVFGLLVVTSIVVTYADDVMNANRHERRRR